MRFLQLLSNTAVFVLKILLLLWIFFIGATPIWLILGLDSEFVVYSEKELISNLPYILFWLVVFYLPSCKLVNFFSLFPSINPRKSQLYSRLITLIFYLFIVAISWSIATDKLSEYARIQYSTAKAYISIINRAQQSYFQENKTFAPTVDALRLGIKTETENFQYSLMSTNQAAFHYAVSKDKKLKSYVGGVFVIDLQEEINTLSILCRTNKPSTIKPLPPTLERGQLTCGAETTEVTN